MSKMLLQEKRALWMSGGGGCQEEGMARTKAWKREGAWAVPEMVQTLSYLEGSEQGDKKVVGCGGRGEILSLCQLCFDSDDSGASVMLQAEEGHELVFIRKILPPLC